MPSFQLSVSPHRRAAAKFIALVRRRIQSAYAERSDLTQTAIANELGIHRSVVNRQLRGYQDMTLGRVAELAFVLGFEPEFHLVRPEPDYRANEVFGGDSHNPFSKVMHSSTALETTHIQKRELEFN